MNQTEFEMDEDMELPADLDELERVSQREMWEPVLLLPRPKTFSGNPAWGCHGDVDYNAFASVDFSRMMPEFDKAMYKADKLKDELKNAAILMGILDNRIKHKDKYKVLKSVRMKVIDVDEISDWDMWQLARTYMKALKLRKEISELQEASRKRKIQRVKRWLESLG